MTQVAVSSLMPVEQALRTMLASLSSLERSQLTPLDQALGRVLAEDARAPQDVPAYDNSAMDGYALRLMDLNGVGSLLPISQRITAGHPGVPLKAGTAARIFTGAAIPEGADAVVIQEDCEPVDRAIRILEVPEPGANIRRRGHDVGRGEVVLSRGQRLRAQDLGLLASLGQAQVLTSQPLRVAIVNTGDEVVAPGQPLAAGQLYDSNSYTLSGLLTALGCEVEKLGIVEDSPGSTRERLAEAARRADCLISTGGVSVGEEDHVRAAVESLGSLSLWKLAIKPGKPFAFGEVAGKPFFGLPGNPVAVFVTFLFLVRPCLLRLLGARQLEAPSMLVEAGFSQSRAGSRQEYIRVRCDRCKTGRARLLAFGNQGSSLMSSLSWADGLAVIPADRLIQEGDALQYFPFSGLLA